jgi:hypothetical protein
MSKKSAHRDESGHHLDELYLDERAGESCEAAVPSGGLSIRRSREMRAADNKYPSARVDVAGSISFDPRTTSCDSLLYSGEVPISTLPSKLPFPDEVRLPENDCDENVEGKKSDSNSPRDDKDADRGRRTEGRVDRVGQGRRRNDSRERLVEGKEEDRFQDTRRARPSRSRSRNRSRSRSRSPSRPVSRAMRK